MPVYCISNGVRVSPRKVGQVAALVNGRSTEDAMVILDNTPRRSANLVKQAIKSADANAVHNHGYKPGTLVITEISVTGGNRLKRFRPAARGRALRFQRKTSNIRIAVDGQKRDIKKKPVPKVAKKETK